MTSLHEATLLFQKRSAERIQRQTEWGRNKMYTWNCNIVSTSPSSLSPLNLSTVLAPWRWLTDGISLNITQNSSLPPVTPAKNIWFTTAVHTASSASHYHSQSQAHISTSLYLLWLTHQHVHHSRLVEKLLLRACLPACLTFLFNTT